MSFSPNRIPVRPSLRSSIGWLLFLAVTFYFGCHDPLTVSDDVRREIDQPLPELDGVHDDATEEFNYHTRPTWTWRSDPKTGICFFRVRLNGGVWSIVDERPCEPDAHYTYTPAGDLYPGTYFFEVQERNDAGNWSESCRSTTTILVRPPVLEVKPRTITNERNVTVSWFSSPQWGNGGDGVTLPVFSWRTERREGNTWLVVANQSAVDREGTSEGSFGPITLGPLDDGIYRIGAAERNAGGSRSTFYHRECVDGGDPGDYIVFRVDTIPPNPPINLAAVDQRTTAGGSVYLTTSSTTFTWDTGGPDGIGAWEYRLSGPSPVTGGTIVPHDTTSLDVTNLVADGTYTLEVREYDAAGNVSNWTSLTFDVKTITVTNPASPTVSIIGEPVLVRSDPDLRSATYRVDSGGALIQWYTWLINGVVVSEGETADTVTIDSAEGVLEGGLTDGGGTFVLTLVVEIEGVPYSCSLGIVVVE